MCEMSSFCHCVDEVFALLVCYTAYVGVLFPDISAQPIGLTYMDCLTLEDGTDTLS